MSAWQYTRNSKTKSPRARLNSSQGLLLGIKDRCSSFLVLEILFLSFDDSLVFILEYVPHNPVLRRLLLLNL